jgi:curved DNA-binding protein
VHEKPFVDYYEVLQLSQSASAETLERVYRLLAKRYHPDNQDSGDADRFSEVNEAYQVLSDQKRRAQYDVTYDEQKSVQWRIFDQGSAADGRETDRRIFHALLSLLYVARRRNPRQGGLGAVYIERMLGVPKEHLEFPLWYLRKKGWVETTDTGALAITVEGIDSLTGKKLDLPADRLLAESSLSSRKDAEPAASTPAALGEKTPASKAGPSPVKPAPPAGTGTAGGGDASSGSPGGGEPVDDARERVRTYEQTLRGSRS